MDIFAIIGLFTATFTTIAFVPQAMQVIKTKQTKDLSLPMYIFFNKRNNRGNRKSRVING